MTSRSKPRPDLPTGYALVGVALAWLIGAALAWSRLGPAVSILCLLGASVCGAGAAITAALGIVVRELRERGTDRT